MDEAIVVYHIFPKLLCRSPRPLQTVRVCFVDLGHTSDVQRIFGTNNVPVVNEKRDQRSLYEVAET